MSGIYQMLSPLAKSPSVEEAPKSLGSIVEGKIYKYKWESLYRSNGHSDDCKCLSWMGEQIRYVKAERIKISGFEASPYPNHVDQQQVAKEDAVFLSEECVGEEVDEDVKIDDRERVISGCDIRIREGGVYKYRNKDAGAHYHGCSSCDRGACHCTKEMLREIERVKVVKVEKCGRVHVWPETEEFNERTSPFHVTPYCLEETVI